MAYQGRSAGNHFVFITNNYNQTQQMYRPQKPSMVVLKYPVFSDNRSIYSSPYGQYQNQGSVQYHIHYHGNHGNFSENYSNHCCEYHHDKNYYNMEIARSLTDYKTSQLNLTSSILNLVNAGLQLKYQKREMAALATPKPDTSNLKLDYRSLEKDNNEIINNDKISKTNKTSKDNKVVKTDTTDTTDKVGQTDKSQKLQKTEKTNKNQVVNNSPKTDRANKKQTVDNSSKASATPKTKSAKDKYNPTAYNFENLSDLAKVITELKKEISKDPIKTASQDDLIKLCKRYIDIVKGAEEDGKITTNKLPEYKENTLRLVKDVVSGPNPILKRQGLEDYLKTDDNGKPLDDYTKDFIDVLDFVNPIDKASKEKQADIDNKANQVLDKKADVEANQKDIEKTQREINRLENAQKDAKTEEKKAEIQNDIEKKQIEKELLEKEKADNIKAQKGLEKEEKKLKKELYDKNIKDIKTRVTKLHQGSKIEDIQDVITLLKATKDAVTNNIDKRDFIRQLNIFKNKIKNNNNVAGVLIQQMNYEIDTLKAF